MSDLKIGDQYFDSPDASRSKSKAETKTRKRRFIMIFSVLLVLGGVYVLILTFSPATTQIPGLSPRTSIDLNTTDDAQDMHDRIQIQKINLEVPFMTGEADTLDRGAWHRYPERGDPKKGGNFILSAHRFNIGITPDQTKLRSPFYNLDKLQVGDKLRIFFDKQWYDYSVTKTYSVKPDAIQIENPSKDAKLTLYSCSLGGSADGRIVIEATTQAPRDQTESD